jgi:hypothetical protein
MGELLYGNANVSVSFEDRALVHLQTVIGSKLRRHESFFFTWVTGVEHGGGRESVWLDGAIQIRFSYTRNTREILNREWIELLNKSANSSAGLQFVVEPSSPEPDTAPETEPKSRSETPRSLNRPTVPQRRFLPSHDREPVHTDA